MKYFFAIITAVVIVVSVAGGATGASTATAAAPNAPTGVTGRAATASVELAWQPVAGATSYAVYRGTAPASVTTAVSPGGVTGTSFTDASAANGTTYYYAVRSVSGGVESSNSLVVQATPAAPTCSSGNPVVLENCRPGDTTWKTVNAGRVTSGGIEGYATAQSINKGQSIDLKINSGTAANYNVQIYRSGYYGSRGARLFSTIRSVPGTPQPDCITNDTTGLIDCSNWSTSLKLTTTSSWPTGVYIARIIRTDNNSDYEILFVVRDDARRADLVYGVSFATYQAYNNFGGKSLYDYNSIGNNTVAGTPRAVKVSFDRPYEQPRSGANTDWYDKTDWPTVYWLERSGYDVTYVSGTDLDQQPALLSGGRRAFLSPSHDEYWSAGMRSAVTQARNAGVGLFFSGSNAVFWKVRFEASPVSGTASRVLVCYKTTAGGPVDPSGVPTGLWRDTSGANQPENALVGVQYRGDADTSQFPLVINSQQGKDRIYRYTGLGNLAAGDSQSIQGIVGWEWDARANNGAEPPGLVTLAASPVSGNLFSSPYVLTQGSTTVNATKYVASSGALVFATGTNFWNRGLALSIDGFGHVDTIIQQTTTNVLADMGVQPATPAPDIVLDTQGPPQVIATSPSDGSVGAVRTAPVVVSFSRAMNPGTITTSTFTLTRPDGTLVPASVSYDSTSALATLTPSASLNFATQYTGHLSTQITASDGQALAAVVNWTFTTEVANPPQITSTTPVAGATGISPLTQVRATFSRPLDPTTLGPASYTLQPSGGAALQATIAYDANSQTATLTPSAQLQTNTTYTARLETTITAIDGAPLASPFSWTFTTSATPPVPPTVTAKSPGDGATGISRSTTVTAAFSRAMNPSTITTATLRLLAPDGSAVAGAVTYDSTILTATFAPTSPLAVSTTYTARVEVGASALDGTPLAAAIVWTFRTQDPLPPPTVTATAPQNGVSGVSRTAVVTATFSRSMDPATLTSSSFTLTPAGGSSIAATVTYDDASHTATLRPSDSLPPLTTMTARLEATAAASDGTALAAPVTWSFSSAACPCSLISSTASPAQQALSTQDSRTGPGPFTYEMGVKVKVDSAMQVDAIRFFKSPGETGTHVGKIWTSAGVSLGQVTFAGETPTGWQEQSLPSPVVLSPGTVYIISVNMNAYYVFTQGGLATQIDSGPLHSVADGLNGVFGSAAGVFPTSSWNSSNYFVDLRVTNANLSQPTVTSTAPAPGSTDASVYAPASATFSRSMDPSSITTSTFTLKRPDGSVVAAAVSYDDSTKTATLTPSSALATSTTYTATLDGTIRALDGTPLGTAASWTFTTTLQPPSPPTVTAMSPSDGATLVSRTTAITAMFSRSMNAGSLTAASFTVGPTGGSAVAGTVTYDASTLTATLRPTQPLAGGTDFTVRLDTSVRAADGTVLPTPITWHFATAACPCTLFSNTLQPASVHLGTDDGRTGTGPWTYEMGVKVTVDQPMDMTSVRFYKSAGETGVHIGRVWTSGGTQLAQVTFGAETASGWQEQALTSPITLQPGSTYVVSVNMNAYYVMTQSGLATSVGSGPLHSVVGSNGVFGSAAGVFPTSSWNSSNYFVDLSAVPNGNPVPLSVTSVSPANGATGIQRGVNVSAVFSRSVDPATLTASTFKVTQSGAAVPGAIAYDATSQTATFTPTSPLNYATTYTGQLTTQIRAVDGQALGSAVTWSFQTAPQPTSSLVVASTSPASGASGVLRDAQIAATLSRTANASTVTTSTFVLKDSGGAVVPAVVTYDGPSMTARLTPTTPLLASSVYTAQLTAGIQGDDGTPLTAFSWSFTTGACPCSLFPGTLVPASTGNPVDDGRTGPGPFSYEMGVKIRVSQQASLTALRFYKSSGETGTHIGRVWTAAGTQLAQVTFAGETASGWQQQALSTPLTLQPNTVYVVSVGINKFYSFTGAGLATQVTTGPLQSVADGKNGVYGSAAGIFPASSYNNANYFIDLVVR